MPTIRDLVNAVIADTSSLQQAAQNKLNTSAALNTAQQNDNAASTALMNALAGGNQQQIQQAASNKLATTAALNQAQQADISASTAMVNAQVQLANDQAALDQAIAQLLGQWP